VAQPSPKRRDDLVPFDDPESLAKGVERGREVVAVERVVSWSTADPAEEV
jgi:hypothetical protein